MGPRSGRELGWLLTTLVATSLLLTAGLAASAAAGGADRQAPGNVTVGPGGSFETLQAALDAAQPGDTVEVLGGSHPGPIVVETDVTILGREDARIEGPGHGTVIDIEAPGAELRGFTIRGSGSLHHEGDAAIRIAASNVTVADTSIEEALFGIWVEQADHVRLINNTIRGMEDLPLPRRGDGIRTWYSQDVEIAGNTVQDARDMVFWYSEDLTMADNTVTNSRYGVHMMYSDRATIRGNHLTGNAVGAYIMYTTSVDLTSNLFEANRGASGYGLAFKEASDVHVLDNLLVDNAVGVYLDTTPFQPGSDTILEGNALVHNDAGALVLPSVSGAMVVNNTFLDNEVQVTVHGSGSIGQNTWRGNHWSDYTGFDGDGDGAGETPYRSQRLFDVLTEEVPELKALRYGPVVQTLEFASRAFPLITPRPTVVDHEPQLAPGASPIDRPGPPGSTQGIAVAALTLLGIGIAALSPVAVRPRDGSEPVARPPPGDPAEAEPLIDAASVTKRFGRTPVLDEVAFSARPGEALALWGPNGAGKTTLLKAVLGLLRYKGEISVAGHDPSHDGKHARSHIGYVPQHVQLPDWRVATVMRYFARLRNASPDRVTELTEQLDLGPHVDKRVSQLSGGLRQRVALGLALLSDPSVLLLDEPTSNLDPVARQAYIELIASLVTDGKLLIFSSHRLEEVEALADRVLILEDGRVQAVRQPEELADDLGGPRRIRVVVEDACTGAALEALAAAGIDAQVRSSKLIVEGTPEDRRATLSCLQAADIGILDIEEGPSRWT